MLLTKHTPRKTAIISDHFSIYAWGGMNVTIEIKDLVNEKESYLVDFTERDLRSMLKKIEDRKEEIDIEMENFKGE